MSVTVADLLELPSMRGARVLGGHKGLGRIVSSISILESVNPAYLTDGMFPDGEFFGSEIVITGFLNILDDVELQCANIRRLAEGGEVGLILFYVGVYMKSVDQRLIDLADEYGFVLITMPEGEKLLRYSEVIMDVTECIYWDRMRRESIVSDILGRISDLPAHQRSINTVLKMLSDRLSATVLLKDASGQILNLIAWPRNREEQVKQKLGQTHGEIKLPEGETAYFRDIRTETGRNMELAIIKEGGPLHEELLYQAADIVRISLNIWNRGHGEIAVRELVRAILQDEPIKMHRLADIFHIDVSSIHEMWVLHGGFSGKQHQFEEILGSYPGLTVCDQYEDCFLFFLSTPDSPKQAEMFLGELLEAVREDEATIVRYSHLQDTGNVREAFLAHQKYLEDARKIFPGKRIFCHGEMEFARECRCLIEQGEDSLKKCTDILAPFREKQEGADLEATLRVYFLDGDMSVSKTAELLYIHKNTVKYRLRRISGLLGCRLDQMPECMYLYQAAAVSRLVC